MRYIIRIIDPNDKRKQSYFTGSGFVYFKEQARIYPDKQFAGNALEKISKDHPTAEVTYLNDFVSRLEKSDSMNPELTIYKNYMAKYLPELRFGEYMETIFFMLDKYFKDYVGTTESNGSQVRAYALKVKED